MPRVAPGEPNGPFATTGQRSEQSAAPATLWEAERPGFQAVARLSGGSRSPAPAAASGRLADGGLQSQEPVVELGRAPEDRSHLPIHGLRDSFGTWVYETYGVKQAQEWLGHSDPATTLRHYVRLTTAARAKAVAGLDEVTRAALEAAEERATKDAMPAPENVVSLASRRR